MKIVVPWKALSNAHYLLPGQAQAEHSGRQKVLKDHPLRLENFLLAQQMENTWRPKQNQQVGPVHPNFPNQSGLLIDLGTVTKVSGVDNS